MYMSARKSGQKTEHSVLKILLLLLLAGVLSFGLLLGIVLHGSHDDFVSEPDTMIILGCKVEPWGPSILLRDRLDKAVEYLEDHPDMLVVVSGGQGPDEPESEAEAMADYLVSAGVSPECVHQEKESHNTAQNFARTREVLSKIPSADTDHVLVVSNGFHLTRVRMLAERAGFTHVSTLAAPSSHVPSRLKMYIREPLALVKSFIFDRT